MHFRFFTPRTNTNTSFKYLMFACTSTVFVAQILLMEVLERVLADERMLFTCICPESEVFGWKLHCPPRLGSEKAPKLSSCARTFGTCVMGSGISSEFSLLQHEPDIVPWSEALGSTAPMFVRFWLRTVLFVQLSR